MNKILISIFVLLLPFSGYAKIYDLSPYNNLYSSSYLDDQMVEFGDLFSQILNSGLGEAINSNGMIDFGIAFRTTSFDRDGAINSNEVSYSPSTDTFVSFSLFNFLIFVREISIVDSVGPGSGGPTIILGGGIGYIFELSNIIENFPAIKVTPVLTYNTPISMEQMISVNSFGFLTQISLDIERVNPFFNVGFSYTKFDTEIFTNDSLPYSYEHISLNSSIGVRIGIFFYEFSYLPTMGHSFGLNFTF